MQSLITVQYQQSYAPPAPIYQLTARPLNLQHIEPSFRLLLSTTHNSSTLNNSIHLTEPCITNITDLRQIPLIIQRRLPEILPLTWIVIIVEPKIMECKTYCQGPVETHEWPFT